MSLQNSKEHSDNTNSDVVVRAWKNAIQLAKDASASLKDIMPDSAKYNAFWDQNQEKCKKLKDGKTLSAAGKAMRNLCYRHFIAQNNLAYGQYFGADPENIQLSKAHPVYLS